MSEAKGLMLGTCYTCGRSAQRDKTQCKGCYRAVCIAEGRSSFSDSHDTCSNCGHRVCQRAPTDTETRCVSCFKKGLCSKKNCHWTTYDIDHSCGKHAHCGYCDLVCCSVCQGCTTRNCSCEEATRCPCRRRH